MHPNYLIDTAGDLLGLVLRFEHPADAVLSKYFRENKTLGPRERGTLAEAVYCVLRLKPRFEHFIKTAPHIQGRFERKLALLGLSQATTLPLDMLSPTERDWLTFCKQVDVATLPAAAQHNLPIWLADLLFAQYGAEGTALTQSLLQAAPLDLRVNSLKGKRDEVFSNLRSRGVVLERTPYSPLGLRLEGKPQLQKWPEFEKGIVEVQDEGSQLLAELVAPKRGEMVADFCAGAGGKTLALGALMRNTGRLYAFDVSAKRLDRLAPRLARSGLSNVHPIAIDSERDSRIKRLAGKMDRVLVDAPCSGLGTLRRNPDLKWRQTPAAIAEMAIKQLAILSAAATLVKPGGRLVYGTCSLLNAENSAVVEQFLAKTPGFTLDGVGLFANSLGLANQGDTLTLLPHRDRTDGFFAAVFVREVAELAQLPKPDEAVQVADEADVSINQG
jgi:16S rRNA (cytosine967-C5)-methyltransferase